MLTRGCGTRGIKHRAVCLECQSFIPYPTVFINRSKRISQEFFHECCGQKSSILSATFFEICNATCWGFFVCVGGGTSWIGKNGNCIVIHSDVWQMRPFSYISFELLQICKTSSSSDDCGVCLIVRSFLPSQNPGGTDLKCFFLLEEVIWLEMNPDRKKLDQMGVDTFPLLSDATNNSQICITHC